MNIVKFGSFLKIPNKFWEIQISTRFDTPAFNIELCWVNEGDHRRVRFLFEIRGFMLSMTIYDNRHEEDSRDMETIIDDFLDKKGK